MADFVRLKPSEIILGDTLILAALDDDLEIQDYEVQVERVTKVSPQRYAVHTSDGERHLVGSRNTLRVVR